MHVFNILLTLCEEKMQVFRTDTPGNKPDTEIFHKCFRSCYKMENYIFKDKKEMKGNIITIITHFHVIYCAMRAQCYYMPHS